MGAEPWEYFTPYKPDINLVLQELRKQEFAAGRYYMKTTSHQKFSLSVIHTTEDLMPIFFRRVTDKENGHELLGRMEDRLLE